MSLKLWHVINCVIDIRVIETGNDLFSDVWGIIVLTPVSQGIHPKWQVVFLMNYYSQNRIAHVFNQWLLFA